MSVIELEASVEEPAEFGWRFQPGAQKNFFECPVQEVLAEGERGGGKSDSVIISFCTYVGKGFGRVWTGILFAQSYKALEEVLKKVEVTVVPAYPDGYATLLQGQSPVLKFETGERLLFRHFGHPRDYRKSYHGHEYPWIGWEELTSWPTDECYTKMFSCNRFTRKGGYSGPKPPLMIRATTNPYGPGHSWVKERFKLPIMRNKVQRNLKDDHGYELPERASVYFSLNENKVLLDESPTYKSNIAMAANNPSEFAAWMDGSWDIVAGGMFDDIWIVGHKHIVVEPFRIPDGWYLDRSFDWGSAHPFSVGWWAESNGSDFVDAYGKTRASVKGDLYRVAEWYGTSGSKGDFNRGKDLTPEEVSKGIIERELKWGWYGKVRKGPADSAIFTETVRDQSIGKSMAQPVMINGRTYPGIGWNTCTKERVVGWQIMRTYMKAAIPPKSIVRERRGLFVFSTCEHFRRTVPILPRDENDLEDADTESEDHIADESRYRCVYVRPVIRSGTTTGDY